MGDSRGSQVSGAWGLGEGLGGLGALGAWGLGGLGGLGGLEGLGRLGGLKGLATVKLSQLVIRAFRIRVGKAGMATIHRARHGREDFEEFNISSSAFESAAWDFTLWVLVCDGCNVRSD